jgi:hypothetical protein
MAAQLSREEFLSVCRVCGVFQLPSQPADVREFVAGLLGDRDPELAAKVRAVDEDELSRLCEAVRSAQEWLRG